MLEEYHIFTGRIDFKKNYQDYLIENHLETYVTKCTPPPKKNSKQNPGAMIGTCVQVRYKSPY